MADSAAIELDGSAPAMVLAAYAGKVAVEIGAADHVHRNDGSAMTHRTSRDKDVVGDVADLIQVSVKVFDQRTLSVAEPAVLKQLPQNSAVDHAIGSEPVEVSLGE